MTQTAPSEVPRSPRFNRHASGKTFTVLLFAQRPVGGSSARRPSRWKIVTTMLDVTLKGGAQAVPAARAALDELALGYELDKTRRADLQLLVSELVSNSVRHAHAAQVALHAELDPGRCVRIEVHDAGPGFTPIVCPGRREGTGGWGLFLVDQLADRWGVRYDDDGSVVWLELDLDAALTHH